MWTVKIVGLCAAASVLSTYLTLKFVASTICP